MLYEPLPGSAAVILVQLGIIEEGQIEALGQRTYDAECARLSLALDDGRTVELERAMHLQSEDGYAVRIRSRAGQTISRSFIHIDRNLAVRNLHNDRTVYIDDIDEPDDAPTSDFSPLETAAHTPAAQPPSEQQPAEEFPAASSIHATDETHQEPQPEVIALHEAPEPVAESEPELHLEAVLAAEATRETAPEPTSVLFGSSEPTPEASAAPEFVPEPASVEQTEAAAEEPLATDDLAAMALAEPESSIIESSESSPMGDEIAAEPETSVVPSSELDTSAPIETPSAAAALEEPSLATPTEPEPEELQPAALEAAPKPQQEPEPEPVDHRYIPLNESLAPEDAVFFEFIAQTGTVHTYEHRETFRYIHIDAPSGLFYDQTRTPISRSAALRHALTPRVPAPPIPEPESNPTSAPQAAVAEPIPLAPPPITEPELRTRSHSLTNGHARAAVKLDSDLDPDPATPPPGTGLSLDAFTRKRAQLERDSWRVRFAELSRALRGNRTPTDDI